MNVQRLAAIDIGSNSIRMAVAQVVDGDHLEVLERLERPVRLGQDTFQHGSLRNENVRTAVSIMRDFRDALTLYKIDRPRAVATSAVREASNGDAFLDRVWMATGIEVAIISGAEESRITISAVRQCADAMLSSRKDVLVAQVGGGNTVLNLIDQGQISTSQSLPIGSIRQPEVLSISTETTEQAAKLIQHEVSGALSTFRHLIPLKEIQTFIAVGGDIKWAAGQVGRFDAQQGVWMMAKKDFERLVKECCRHSPDQLTKVYGLSFVDAETLIPALLIHQILLRATQADQMIVPNVAMIDGLLQEQLSEMMGVYDTSANRQIIQSAVNLAKKYRVDVTHAKRVSQMALRLFDRLQQTHRLEGRYRLLLEVAGLLHEIGTFVSSRRHHKHTLYLIQHSEVFGLTQEELLVVANIARYHRRGRPKPPHVEYMALSRNMRMVVNKLTALLRVADALDMGRTQQIGACEFDVQDETLVIHVSTQSDLALEKKALMNKSDIFQDIYGLDIHIEQDIR